MFLPLFLLYFCLSFIYNGLRPLKMSLVMAASSAGAEIIPFLKVWGIVPGAVFFTWLFARLSRRFNFEKTFYVMILIFLGYFLFFAAVLLPANEFCTLDGLSSLLGAILPEGFRGFISMVRYWHLSLFYVFCEVWSSSIMFVLYWGFVNEVTPIESAGRFYPLYNLGGNLASTVVGLIVTGFSRSSGTDQGLDFALRIILLLVAVGGLSIALYRYASQNYASKNTGLLAHPDNAARRGRRNGGVGPTKEKKISFSLMESLKHLFRSRYLLFLLVLVIAYNLVFNLVDVMWSQKVKDYFGKDWVQMAGFMGRVTTMKGLLSSVFVFAAHVIIRRFGWKKAAMITPLSILITSLMFFPLISFEHSELFSALVVEWFNTSALWLAVFVGSFQNSLTRGTKYSIYDSVKEMAFIPLSTDLKRQGKAVIDGIASRLGKSSGSVFYMVLLPVCGSLQATIPFIAFLAVSVTLFWLYSISSLDRLMKEELKKKQLSRLAGGKKTKA